MRAAADNVQFCSTRSCAKPNSRTLREQKNAFDRAKCQGLAFLYDIGDRELRLLVAVLPARMRRFGRHLEAIARLQTAGWLALYGEVNNSEDRARRQTCESMASSLLVSRITTCPRAFNPARGSTPASRPYANYCPIRSKAASKSRGAASLT
jgi:hypothetical protein